MGDLGWWINFSPHSLMVAIRIYRTRPLLSRPFSSTPPFAASDDDDNSIVSSAITVLRDLRSRSRWNHLRSLYPAGFTPSQASAILLRLRNNPRLALRFFHWSRLCPHDLSTYAAVVHVLARSRLRHAALSLLLPALRINTNHSPSTPPPIFEALVKTYRQFDSAPFVFDLLIRAYLQSKKIDDALQITRLLISRTIYPLPATANSLIRFISSEQGSTAGLELYRELFAGKAKPNVQTFNTLLLALYREGRLDSVSIRGEMEGFECEPNAYTYSVLMAGFCDEGRMAEAKTIWMEMTAKGVKPDIVAFNTMIGGYCNAGEVMSAEELFVEMGLGGIEATCTTFEHLVRGHLMVGDVDGAVLVFQDMRRRGHPAEVTMVDEVIEGMCESGRVVEGLGILRKEMKRERGGFCPSRMSYEQLIRGFCDKGELEQALELQAEMVGRGFESGVEVYHVFIEAYSKKGDVEKADKLKDEMLERISQEGR